MPDAEAAERLVSHRYFRPHVTPVQVLNRATDPFLRPPEQSAAFIRDQLISFFASAARGEEQA